MVEHLASDRKGAGSTPASGSLINNNFYCLTPFNTPNDYNYDDKASHLIFYGWSKKYWMMMTILQANGEEILE